MRSTLLALGVLRDRRCTLYRYHSLVLVLGMNTRIRIHNLPLRHILQRPISCRLELQRLALADFDDPCLSSSVRLLKVIVSLLTRSCRCEDNCCDDICCCIRRENRCFIVRNEYIDYYLFCFAKWRRTKEIWWNGMRTQCCLLTIWLAGLR